MASLPPTWFEVELWSASCVERWSNTRPSYIWSDGVSRSPNNLPTEIQSRSSNKDTEERWSNRGPSYIQSTPLQTKIQSNVDGTHDSYIQHALSIKIEATTLWIEHTMITQQGYRYRGNNIVDRIGTSWNNSDRLLFWNPP